MQTKNNRRGHITGTPEYVIAHGNWRLKRKRGFSAVLNHNETKEKNPKKAYSLAKDIIARRLEEAENQLQQAWHRQFRSGQTDLEAFLGIEPLPNDAQKVPHTSY